MTTRRPSSSLPLWPLAIGAAFGIGMSGCVSSSPAASMISRLIQEVNGSPVTASITRPMRPNPWLEYLKRVLGSMAGAAWRSAISSSASRKGRRSQELAGLLAVADDAGAVGEDLAERGAGNPRVQTVDVVSDRVVELELALLAQLHHAGGGEALGMRGDAKAMARREADAPGQVGVAEAPARGRSGSCGQWRSRSPAARTCASGSPSSARCSRGPGRAISAWD